MAGQAAKAIAPKVVNQRKKFFELKCDAPWRRVPYASGFGPLPGGMPFLHPNAVKRLEEYCKVNPMKPGLHIEGEGKRWPDFLMNGSGYVSFFVSGKVVMSMQANGLPLGLIMEMPIAEVAVSDLEGKAPPSYFVIKPVPGIEVDLVASEIAVDAEGGPLPKQPSKPWYWSPKLRLDTWNGADLFCSSNYGANTSFVCTQAVVDLAKRDRWSYCKFDPIWAI